MNAMNYTRSFILECSSMEAFDAIRRVREWWTLNTHGSASAVGDEFTVQFGEVHLTTQRVVDVVAGRRMVWRVTRSRLPWLKDAGQWKGTEMIFDITEEAAGTRITFTHVGLTPLMECCTQCEKGWDYFIGTSLRELITGGAGKPDTTKRTHMDIIGHVHSKNA